MGRVHKNELVDDLANAYEQMLEHAIGDFYQSEQKTERTLRQLIEKAKNRFVELKELSQEQADQVAEYVSRDINHLRDYLSTTKNELKDWLGFEAVVLESEILDLLVKAADSATVDMILRNSASPDPKLEYSSGEIAGPGTLACAECGTKIELHRATKLPLCSACEGSGFTRNTR